MSKALATKNVAAVLLGIGMILSVFSFAAPAKAATTMDMQSQINALLAQIAALQGSSSSTSCSFTFTANLKMGSKGAEVMNLQKFLNKSSDTTVAVSGAGSAGNETSTFGPATKRAVVKFQNKYAADILTPNGLSKGTGNWFVSTRAKANMLCTTTGGTTGGTTPPPGSTPGTLMVSAGSQPANSLAPAGSARVPFTNFTLTNSSNAAVTINGITVTRTGLAQDGVFAGVVLLDQNGLQIGTPRTFDTNHMATIGETMTLQAGQSMTFTVAGNMNANLSAFAGQVAALQVTGINTTSTVSGSLPISGANQTINASLSVGTATIANSSFDPNSAQTKNIGDTAVKFSGIRITAGSQEDVRLFSVRWRLNGSASASDISNVMTVINGTSYPTTVSADGRYFTTTVAGGILMTKGNSADVYVMGDITGTNSNTRVIEFDIDRPSDIYIVGQTYGYGITPTSASFTGATPSSLSTHASGFFGTGVTPAQPMFQGSTVTVQGSSVTSIARATEVPSQNIAVNVPNQNLGGFVADIKGEALTVQTIALNIYGLATSTSAQLTNVTLVDDAGVVLAGPVDAVNTLVTFNNSITLKSGRHVYTIKGKVATGVPNGATYAVTVNTANFTGVTGQQTGNTVVIPASTFTLNTMTVRGATLNITAAASPAAQSIVAGGSAVTLANIQLDASQSGEDIRVNQVPVNFSNITGVSACQLWNGTTAVNTGSNTVTPIATGVTNFTFDNSLTVAKGAVVTLAVKCNLSSAATLGYTTGVPATPSTYAATGVQSGSSLVAGTNLTATASNSGTQTVGTSALVASQSNLSPSFTLASGGTVGITVAAIKLKGTGEDMSLTELGITGSTGVNSDVLQATIWNGATQVGTISFTSGSLTATSTLSTPVTLPKDTDVVLTIKANVANVGPSQVGTPGRVVVLNFSGAKATGNNSGNTIYATGNTNVEGVRIERTFPSVGQVAMSSTGVADGKLIRFSVLAGAGGDVGITKFTFTVATSSVTATNFNLYAFQNSDFQSSAVNGGNPLNVAPLNTAGVTGAQTIVVNTNGVTATPAGIVQVPAGSTYYFELRATVTGVQVGSSITTILLGDASGTNTGATSTVSTQNFLWTPNSTSTTLISDTANTDWRNGRGVPGLSSSGITQTRNQ